MHAAVGSFDVVRQAFDLMLGGFDLLIECTFLDRCNASCGGQARHNLALPFDHVVAPRFAAQPGDDFRWLRAAAQHDILIERAFSRHAHAVRAARFRDDACRLACSAESRTAD